MARPHVIFGILILQLYVNAAPSNISKLEEIATTEKDSISDDDLTVVENENNTLQQTVRQKRFYNYYGYGFPPISPIIYPSYVKRDESADTGVYGSNDPFDQIHKRLQEITTIIRQPPPPPAPPVHIPIFFPVIFVPQGCICNTPTNDNTPQEPITSTEANPTTNPNVTQRLPDIVDEDYETDYEDNNRPISFDPIMINTTLARPPPPVEHGSSQAVTPNNTTSTMDTSNEQANRPTSPDNELDEAQSGSTSPPNEFNSASRPAPSVPSLCDGAVLSCCHQLHVTYDCFALQGCPDPTSYGNPCEVNVILSVIYKFQNYYAQRNG